MEDHSSGFDRRRDEAYARYVDVDDERVSFGNKLVEEHKGLVVTFAKNYFYQNANRLGKGDRLEDVIQQAYYGILKASRRFDYNDESKMAFSTYAWAYMRKSCQELLNGHSNEISYIDEMYSSPWDDYEGDFSEREIKIATIIDEFPDAYKIVMEDLANEIPITETAKKVNLSTQSVYRARDRAIRWIRHLFGEGERPKRPLR